MGVGVREVWSISVYARRDVLANRRTLYKYEQQSPARSRAVWAYCCAVFRGKVFGTGHAKQALDKGRRSVRTIEAILSSGMVRMREISKGEGEGSEGAKEEGPVYLNKTSGDGCYDPSPPA